jgi:hypothetical protein
MRADANKDHIIDAADYILWRKNLGASSGSSIASSSLLNSSPPPVPGTIDATYRDSDVLVVLDGLPASGIMSGGIAQDGAVVLSAVVHTTTDSNGTASLSSLQDRATETLDRYTSLAVFDMLAVQVRVTDISPVVESIASAVALDRNLLLVDAAWADLEVDEDEIALVRRGDEEDDALSKLALAAVFEQYDDSWWSAI